MSIPGDGEGVLEKRESVAGKGRSDQRDRGVEEIRAGAGAAWRSKTSESFPRGRNCRFFASKIVRGRILVLTARAPDFDVY
jgi:hypothetical protein